MKKIISLVFLAFLTFRCVAQTDDSAYSEVIGIERIAAGYSEPHLNPNAKPYFDTSRVVMLCTLGTADGYLGQTRYGYEVSTFDMKGRIHVSYLDPEKKPVKWFVWLSKPIP